MRIKTFICIAASFILYLSLAVVSIVNAQTLSDQLGSGEPIGLRVGISGEVAELFVEAGDRIKAGELLLKLNTEHFLSELNAAQAKLDAVNYQYQLSKENFARQQELYDEGSLSTVELQQLELGVKQVKAERAQARTGVSTAKRKLANAQIISPVAGEIIAVPLIGQRANVESGQDVLIKIRP